MKESLEAVNVNGVLENINHALAQQKYRREVLKEEPRAEGGTWVSPFEAWYICSKP